ncbi:hypothetical protein LTR04_000360 [Oleoguttula sp. CCFEE 6159]|nr:hypothetical protein LTR04_000360 [Oleoguttula sp. CCFEE 6159]
MQDSGVLEDDGLEALLTDPVTGLPGVELETVGLDETVSVTMDEGPELGTDETGNVLALEDETDSDDVSEVLLEEFVKDTGEPGVDEEDTDGVDVGVVTETLGVEWYDEIETDLVEAVTGLPEMLLTPVPLVELGPLTGPTGEDKEGGEPVPVWPGDTELLLESGYEAVAELLTAGVLLTPGDENPDGPTTGELVVTGLLLISEEPVGPKTEVLPLKVG